MEYMEEISDPENRRKYESEIAQMEAERGMDVTFVQPEPGYVLKTNINGEKKAFINIGKSDKIDKPSTERKENENGKRGILWHIPHSFAPPREDFDKLKNRCQVYDFVIHPDTYRMAERNSRFKKLVEDTALDGIERQFQVKLDRKNIKRPKILFKGTPSATVIRTRSANLSNSGLEETGILKDMPYPYDNKTTLEKMNEREEMLEKNEKADASAEKDQKANDSFIPKYTILHRSEMDMQEYRNAPDSKPSTRPKELVIKIELPLLKSAAQANLEIFEKRLLLETKEPTTYKLHLNLPYPVDESEGNATFDKQKKTLTVTLPVIPETTPPLPTFAEGAATNSDTDDNQAAQGKPLVQVLSSNTNDDGPIMEQTADANEVDSDPSAASGDVNSITYSPVTFSLPEFSFTQDAETVSYVLKVKNVTEDSIRRKSPTKNTVQLFCTSRGEGGFPFHYHLYLKFAESCCIVPDNCSVDVTDDNVVLLLLKEQKSRGLWNRFWAGLEEDRLEEHLFLTVSNLQQQLTEMDKAAVAAAEAGASGVEEISLCQLEVTTMNEKKLTVKITPPQKITKILLTDKDAELDDEEHDPPLSAEIEVVHTRPSPSLQSILKQRSVSESSEDINPDPESPRSPCTEDDDLSSSQGSSSSSSSSSASGSKHRSVSFSEHIDKATFKSTAPVKSMQTSLKSKRKRQRKWEEKKTNGSRKRNNSGGSSSGDDHTNIHDSLLQSEEDAAVDDDHNHCSFVEDQCNEESYQGDGPVDTSEVVYARLETMLDFRTKPSENKSETTKPSESKSETTVNSDANTSGKDSGLSEDGKKNFEDPGDGKQTTAAFDDNRTGSNTTVLLTENGNQQPDKKESIAAKIKSNLAECNPMDGSADSDDAIDKKEEERDQEASNPHKTVCAFDFSNAMMFDLDVE